MVRNTAQETSARLGSSRVPSKAVITAGKGYGRSALNAFDSALLDAGIGDLNLIRVSSILPPGAEIIDLRENSKAMQLALGAIVPVVYSYTSSDRDKTNIASAISIGIPRNLDDSGVIFEASILGTASEATQAAETMVVEAFQARRKELGNIVSAAKECCVEVEFTPRHGCVIAAVLLV